MLIIMVKGLKFKKIVCKWKLVFDNDFSIDVKSKLLYGISVLRVLRRNLQKYQKKYLF